MAHIKIEVDSRVLGTTEWAAFLPPEGTIFPRMYMTETRDAKVFITRQMYMWVAKDQISQLTLVEEEILPAPNVGFSEGFILRALAIAQDPKLAKELV